MNNKEMTNKEKMEALIEQGCLHPDDLLISYMKKYPEEFSIGRIIHIVDKLNNAFLYPKSRESYAANLVAAERAFYLKTYLEGDMYTTKEAAEQFVDIQIANAQAIIDVCKK